MVICLRELRKKKMFVFRIVLRLDFSILSLSGTRDEKSGVDFVFSNTPLIPGIAFFFSHVGPG